MPRTPSLTVPVPPVTRATARTLGRFLLLLMIPAVTTWVGLVVFFGIVSVVLG